MPIVDLPLAELRKYKGINPCPDDFDAYWDEAIAEMEAVDLGLSLDRPISALLLRIASICSSPGLVAVACIPNICDRRKLLEKARPF